MEGTLAVITCFAGDFAPRGWAFCNGQVLAINTNQALFSLLGTTYGGNGQTTFALPDLRGRVPISQGQGPGLSSYTLGQVGGSASITLTTANLPSHNHNGNVQLSMQAESGNANETAPDGFYPAQFPAAYGTTPVSGIVMRAPTYTATIQNAGSNQPLPLMPPYLGMNYVICLQGIFPSRN